MFKIRRKRAVDTLYTWLLSILRRRPARSNGVGPRPLDGLRDSEPGRDACRWRLTHRVPALLLASFGWYAIAQGASFSDAPVKEWSQKFWQGDYQGTLASVELELQKPTPHPFAAMVWCKLHLGSGDLDAALSRAKTTVIGPKVTDLCVALHLSEQGENTEVLKRYTDAAMRAPSDFWLVETVAEAADGVGDDDLAERLLIPAIGKNPSQMQLVWDLSYDVGQNRRLRQNLSTALQHGEIDPATPAAAALQLFLHFPYWNPAERIAVGKQWLKVVPDDARAMVMLGRAFDELARFDEAIPLVESAARLFPFYYFPRHLVLPLDRLQRTREAEDFERRFASGSTADPEIQGKRMSEAWARDLRLAGNRGLARQVVSQALEKWPEDAGLQAEAANLEFSDKRWAEAEAHSKRAVQIAPAVAKYREQLMEIDNSDGRPRDALKVLDDLRAAGLQPTLAAYNQAVGAEENLKAYDAELALADEAQKAYPHSAWAQRNRARALYAEGRKGEALEVMRSAIEEDPLNEWAIDKWGAWRCESVEASACLPALRELAASYAWSEPAWQLLITQGGSKASTVWQEVAEAHPESGFAHWNRLWALFQEQHQVEAMTLARNIPGPLASAAPSDQMWAIGIYPSLTAALSEQSRIEADQLTAALTALDGFTGDVVTASRWRSQLLQALGRRKEAAEASLTAATLSDTEDGFEEPLMQFGGELGSRAWQLIRRALDRHPMNPATVSAFVHAHSLWGGSPIVAIKESMAAQQRGVPKGDYCVCAEGKPYGDLGDLVRQFDRSYANSTNISGSDRYVEWFDGVRKGVAANRRTRVRFVDDPAGYAVDITFSDGRVVHRVDDPISGHIIRMSSGPAYVQATYDKETHDLRRITTGAGTWLAIDYNGAGQITRVANNDGQEARIPLYNDAGKPTRIEVKGAGRVDTEYDGSGQVSHVRTTTLDGKEAGLEVGLRVSSLFTQLTEQVELLSPSADPTLPPELPYSDPQHDVLVHAYKNAEGPAEDHATLELARYDEEHLATKISYADEAQSALTRVIERSRDIPGRSIPTDLEVSVIARWMHLMQVTRPEGLPGEDFSRWIRYQSRLAALADRGVPAAREALQRFSAPPKALDDPWFKNTKVGNAGYWRRYGYDDLQPAARRGAEANAVLQRANGDALVGSNFGISVRHRGYWTAYTFDSQEGTFTRRADAPTPDERSRVLSLAETTDGTLWIGTGDGLIAVTGDYDGAVSLWRSQADGLPVARVELLVSDGNRVWLGTAGGARWADKKGIHPVGHGLDDRPVRFISVAGGVSDEGRANGKGDDVNEDDQAAVASAATTPLTILGVSDGVYVCRESSCTRFLDQQVDGAVYEPRAGLFLLLDGNQVREMTWDGSKPPVLIGTLTGTDTLKYSRQIYGLTQLAVDDAEKVPALLTDAGIALFRDWHFELLPLPMESERHGLVVGPKHAYSNSIGSWFITAEGVYGFESARAITQEGSRIYDLLSDDAQGFTFVATGDGIEAINQDHPDAGQRQFAGTRTTSLAKDSSGNLIANDGLTIVRFEKGKARAGELFDAQQSAPEDWRGRRVGNILVARDGAIWVTAGSSVFRYIHDKAEEFNWFVDPQKFPARSEMISRVIETVHGDILVVASNESHLRYQGIALDGGLLRFNGTGFDRVKESDYGGNPYLTGYTPLDSENAIVGTGSGFVRDKAGVYTSFATLKDPSYRRLRARTPMLWLGRNGAAFGEDNWLVPSAGGILVYRKGEWYYPDRLNQLLPRDPELGQYGGRTVHAVAVDHNGNIYAGNDSGLLVYQGATAPGELFIENGHAMDLFADQDIKGAQAQGDVLLKHLRKDSPAWRLVTDLNALDAEQSPSADHPVSGASSSGGARPTNTGAAPTEAAHGPTTLSETLREREQSRSRLLAELERINYGLYQLLKLDPQELAALHTQLAPDQVVLEFIPDVHNLYIQAVTRDGSKLYEVHVTSAELDSAVSDVVQALRTRAAHLTQQPGDPPAVPSSKDERGFTLAAAAVAAQLSDQQLDQRLAWLFDQLIRPAILSMEGKRQIFIVPVGRLSYLPFAVLRDQSGDQARYAAEEFNIGILPSMFQLDLMLRHKPSSVPNNLVLGDPDGSLPGARSEAQAVHALLGNSDPILLGSAATVDGFEHDAVKSRIVHMATHGILDRDHPEDSYLLMAHKVRLDVVDIQTLDLSNTDIVVLSACETGLGRDGLELATLARAFAHANVPTVVATLWPVNDAATRDLIVKFYESYKVSGDSFAALAHAQRELIRSQGAESRPEAWGGLEVFGKP